MRECVNLKLLIMAGVLACGALISGCQSMSASTQHVAEDQLGSLAKDDARGRIDAALARWPKAVRRPFFATIRAAGHRVVAVGNFDYRNADDFRITAVTELGQTLFDVRCKNNECKVLHVMPGLGENIVAMLCRDMSLAWRVPQVAGALEEHKGSLRMSVTDEQRRRAYYLFDPKSGMLTREEIQLGFLDALFVDVLNVDERGWPTELVFNRPARAYTIQLSFLSEQK